MIVRELFAKLGLDVDQAGFIAAEKAISTLRNGFAGVATALIGVQGAMTVIAKSTADYAAQIYNMNAATGVSTELLQTYAYAAKTAGLEFQESQLTLSRFARAAYQASIGSNQEGFAFYKLGVRAYEAYGKVRDINDLLPETATALAKIENPTLRDALAMELFGRGGAKMIQTLTILGTDLDGTAKKARSLGVMLSPENINAGKQLSISFERLGLALKGILLAIGVPLLARTTKMVELMVSWLVAHRKLIAERVHEVFWHVTNALKAFAFIAEYIVNHSMLLKFFTVLAGVVMALTFPLTSLALLLAAIAEDLYLFFNNPKADTLTGALVEMAKKLKVLFDGLWGTFKKDPFGFLYDAASQFFDWFVAEAKKIPSRLSKGFFSEEGFGGQTFLGLTDLLHKIPGFKDVPWKYMPEITGNGTPWSPEVLSAFDSTPSSYRGSPVPSMPPLTVQNYFGPGSDANGQEVGEAFRGILEDWWTGKLRAAQPAATR